MAERTGTGTVYQLDGPEGAPVVALIHGLGVNRQMWQWHLPALSARYRVLSYDLIGHGESAPSPREITLSAFAGQLNDLLEHLGIEHCVLAGFSLGGMINRRFALDYPGRTAGVAILNSPHERDPEAQKSVEERAAQVADGGSDATIEAALKRWFTPEFRAERPEVLTLIRQWRKVSDPESYAQSCMVLASGVKQLIRPDPPLSTPALVMTCENDSGSTPAMSHAIATEIAGAETIIVPRLQHLGLVEAPALFTEPLLQFLDRVFD